MNMTDDLETCVTQALLESLPKKLVAADGTEVLFCRANDPENLSDEDDLADLPSPLFVDRETMQPEILVLFRRNGVECLFSLRQGGILRQELAKCCPPVPSPFENRQ